MMRCKGGLQVVLALLLLCLGQTAMSGQQQEESVMDSMSVEELRAYQSYFFANGMRDPLTMRKPTDTEIGEKDKPGDKVLTVQEQRQKCEEWLERITEAIRDQHYTVAIEISTEALNEIDTWHAINPEHEDLIRMVDEIRNYNRMAVTLKRNEDIKKEFLSLHLRVDGVVWSPTDSKAVINGKTYSAGEVLLDERKQGDLRIEMIEEQGVVFQFRGIRFHLPVEVYAPMNNTGDL